MASILIAEDRVLALLAHGPDSEVLAPVLVEFFLG